MPDARVEALERAAARHWQAPDTEPLGEWQLRAAGGFTGRANSALPLGDPGRPLPAAVTAVEEWYRPRGLRPMIVLPQGAAPDPPGKPFDRTGWLPRSGPAFVMVARLAPRSPRGAPSGCRVRPGTGLVQAPRSSVQAPSARPFGSREGASVKLTRRTGVRPSSACTGTAARTDSHQYRYMMAP